MVTVVKTVFEADGMVERIRVCLNEYTKRIAKKWCDSSEDELSEMLDDSIGICLVNETISFYNGKNVNSYAKVVICPSEYDMYDSGGIIETVEIVSYEDWSVVKVECTVHDDGSEYIIKTESVIDLPSRIYRAVLNKLKERKAL